MAGEQSGWNPHFGKKAECPKPHVPEDDLDSEYPKVTFRCPSYLQTDGNAITIVHTTPEMIEALLRPGFTKRLDRATEHGAPNVRRATLLKLLAVLDNEKVD